ncbi:MAG: sensor histidine kinase [Deltaproteobacteria bacterium]|nr:sensor histidine kinase [Deltaproteobacteria bacterium]
MAGSDGSETTSSQALPPPSGDGASAAERRLAAAVHEAGNALTAVLGWIERAEEASHGGAPAAVAQALDRAASHARAARDVMRWAIGAEPPEQQSAPAGDLARRTIEDIETEARRRGVAVSTELETDGALVEHAGALWRILTNLLLNAIAVSPPGGRVTLHVARQSAERARFTVRDEGPGVPAKLRAEIFASGASLRSGGAGIGLRHAFALAGELGGELRLGESPVGARFDLLWPVAAVAAEAPAAASPAGPATNRPLAGDRVLLLEDDEAVIGLIELGLEARGARLTAVRTAEALLETLEREPDQAVLVDLSPLGPDVEPVLRRVRELRPAAALVVVSGRAALPPGPGGDVGWLRKPFAPAELVEAILAARRRTGASRA